VIPVGCPHVHAEHAALGATSPVPPVNALLVDDGQVGGEAFPL
jgi:hypothetical protein